MENKKIVEVLKRLRSEGKKNKELAEKLNCSPGYLSEVISGKKQAGKDLNDSLEQMLQHENDHNSGVIVNGHSATIEVHEAHRSHEAEMLCEVLEAWDEKKRKRLLRIALEMDEE